MIGVTPSVSTTIPAIPPSRGALSSLLGQRSAFRDCAPPIALSLHVLEGRLQTSYLLFQFCTQAQLRLQLTHP